MVIPVPPWPPHMVPSAAQPQPQPQPQQSSSNLAKMTNMARSTPQLDDNTDGRDRERSRERLHHLQNTRENLISQVAFQLFVSGRKVDGVIVSCSLQVMEAVHGVTIEEADMALQRNEWNPARAQQQLKVRGCSLTHTNSFSFGSS